ncbi:MAG: hypothetical protein E6R08_04040 [Nevskiaceae bacterium]|nr:MAG: hypothetical protein E6R08_04040 [Nevskiaceae bacterium]
MTQPAVIASLDLTCFLQLVLARRSALAPDEREKARRYVLRAMAALGGRPLPAGEAVDAATAFAAFDCLCQAIISLSIATNAELAAHFSETSIQRIGGCHDR